MAPNSSRVTSDMFALVKWLNGPHAGTLTPNLNVKWIREFNPVDHHDASEAYVVEWRRPPMPRSGWPLYDCNVLVVSSDLDFLRQRMEALQLSDDDAEEFTPRRRQMASSNDPPPPYVSEILNSLRSLANQGIPRGGSLNRQNSCSSSSSSSDENQSVMKVGSALVISNTAYIAAKAASSPSQMTMTLVRAAFSKRRLRRSSYAGQKRRDKEPKPSLKKYRKTQDIQDFVKSRFPYLTQAAFGAAVNSCLGKNVDKEKVREFVDESDSDDGEES
ncbi:uncharacterized protein LOC117640568 [Thrips palmi]|uniref:Uncharacterized protein LOC117640568 n=1 Tax=Thrips palmi TaxID=161013 RepID=A0A6P8Y8R1_THRPL|nr:uncharacterized protein LOC117640568 [Thrips palmi]